MGVGIESAPLTQNPYLELQSHIHIEILVRLIGFQTVLNIGFVMCNLKATTPLISNADKFIIRVCNGKLLTNFVHFAV